jgi:hypothetical protein
MSIVPKEKIKMSCIDGFPVLANHNADNVGQSNSKLPMGLSSLTNFA